MIRPLQVKQMLKSAGLKATAQRILVAEALNQATGPLSAPQLHEQLGSKLDRATVYRVLEAFVEAGLVAKLRHNDRAHAYHLVHESLRPRHPHFYCKCCGDSSCLDALSVNVDLSELLDSFPAKVENLEISLEGICPHCLRHKKA
jgi:Fur family ferric uptake transcriptional regulator